MFWSCKKESIADQSTITNTQSKTDLISPIITVSSATTFFKEKFGDDKVGLLRSLPTNLLGDTVRYIPTNIDIKPTWSKAQISTLLKVNPILVVPVENIPTLDASKEGYSLVFYNDSLGHMQSVLQCYVPTIDYYKKVNGKNSTSDFTGYLYQISMSGKIQKVLKIDNGKILGELHHGKLSGTPADGPSDCYSFGGSFWGGISSFFGSLWSGVTNFLNDLPVNSSDPYGGGNNFPPTGSSSGYGDGTLSGFGGGTTSIFDAGNRNGVYDQNTPLENILVGQGIISQSDFENYFRYNTSIIQDTKAFIAQRGLQYPNYLAITNNLSLANSDPDIFKQNMQLLNSNDNYFSQYQSAGFPKVGDDDWILNVAIVVLSRDPFSPGEKIAEFYYQYTSLKTQCPSCSKAKLGFQAFWNVEKDLIQGALSICGIIPSPVGIACNVANGVIYYMDGQGTNATLSIAAAVPFGVVLQKGAWAMRFLANGVEHSLVYSKTAGGLIEFGSRGVIATSVKATTVGNEIHHLIPWGKRVENLVQKAAEVAEDGTAFHMNHPGNGIELTPFRLDQTILDQGVHANHPAYDTRVVQEMDDIWNELTNIYGNNIPAKVARERLIKLQNIIRDAIQNNPGVKINDLIF